MPVTTKIAPPEIIPQNVRDAVLAYVRNPANSPDSVLANLRMAASMASNPMAISTAARTLGITEAEATQLLQFLNQTGVMDEATAAVRALRPS